jgi:transcriptional regulator with XRE-family HTH domain
MELPELIAELRKARGMSQTRLAQYLGELAGRPTLTKDEISRWERGTRRPRWWLPWLARALDVPVTTLERARAPSLPELDAAGQIDVETWTDDLSRATTFVARQSFGYAESLTTRWINQVTPINLGPDGRYLLARSLMVLGDIRRDQGVLLGQSSAQRSYNRAYRLFDALNNARKCAQVDMARTVVTEMNGNLDDAARRYRRLADDGRLSDRDRALARLWIGTAVSKAGNHEYAAKVMSEALKAFEALDEAEDWLTAHQKLALAHRGAGRIDHALACIDVALRGGVDSSPMQAVRLRTAHAHILTSDQRTRDTGVALLDQTAAQAKQYGMAHQLRSIEAIQAQITN